MNMGRKTKIAVNVAIACVAALFAAREIFNGSAEMGVLMIAGVGSFLLGGDKPNATGGMTDDDIRALSTKPGKSKGEKRATKRMFEWDKHTCGLESITNMNSGLYNPYFMGESSDMFSDSGNTIDDI